jgi:hypothetical protein
MYDIIYLHPSIVVPPYIFLQWAVRLKNDIRNARQFLHGGVKVGRRRDDEDGLP